MCGMYGMVVQRWHIWWYVWCICMVVRWYSGSTNGGTYNGMVVFVVVQRWHIRWYGGTDGGMVVWWYV